MEFIRVGGAESGVSRSTAKDTSLSIPSDNFTIHKQASAEAMWGMFVADALAMPVHWYRDPADILSQHGHWITKYEAPLKTHPYPEAESHIHPQNVVGSVILHGRGKFWSNLGSKDHLHRGMAAGENTLTCLIVYRCILTMGYHDRNASKPDEDIRREVLLDYVHFMTSPVSHKDTYAEYFHIIFFTEWLKNGRPMIVDRFVKFLMKREKNEELATIDCLTLLIPWIVRNTHKTKSECIASVLEFAKLTHPSKTIQVYIKIYTSLLYSVLCGADLRSGAEEALESPFFKTKKQYIDHDLPIINSYPRGSGKHINAVQATVAKLGISNQIEGALASVLFLAMLYSDSFDHGIIVNANCCGESCHRGAALGALLGAAGAFKKTPIFKPWKEGLKLYKDLAQMIKLLASK